MPSNYDIVLVVDGDVKVYMVFVAMAIFFYTDFVCLLAGGMMKNLKDLESSHFEFSMCVCGFFFCCVFRLNVIIILVS